MRMGNMRTRGRRIWKGGRKQGEEGNRGRREGGEEDEHWEQVTGSCGRGMGGGERVSQFNQESLDSAVMTMW
jgi:hypothetical protein